MYAQRMRALRSKLEPLARGDISDGNQAITTIAAVLLELTGNDSDGPEISAEEHRRRVDDILQQAEARRVATRIDPATGLTRPYGVKDETPLDSRAVGDEGLKRTSE
jgi:hypothetical protein